MLTKAPEPTGGKTNINKGNDNHFRNCVIIPLESDKRKSSEEERESSEEEEE